MIDQVFAASSYYINFFAFPPLAVSVAILLLGIVVLIRERLSQVGVSFFILTLTIFLWFFSVFWLYSSSGEKVAMFWGKCVYCGVCYIPFAIYYHSVVITGRMRDHFLFLWLSWAISTVFFFLALTSKIFLAGVYHLPWGYYVKIGPAALPFLFYIILVATTSLFLQFFRYRTIRGNTALKKHLENSCLALAIGFLSSIDFLSSYGLTVYPIGYLPIMISHIIITYSIWQYSFGYITPAFAAEEIISTMRDALLVLDRDGIIRVMNQAAAALFTGKRFMIGEPVSSIGTDEHFLYRFSSLLGDTPKNIHNREISYRPESGKEKMLSLSTSVIYDKNQQPAATICIFRDITELKKAEEELRQHRQGLEKIVETRTNILIKTNAQLVQEIAERKRIEEKLLQSRQELRNLSAYLQNIRETERTEIAREIHDELGQILTALHFDVSWLQKRLPHDQPQLFRKTRAMAGHIEQSITTVHKIISELRPGVLDHLNLSDAVEWQINDFMARTGIRCNFRVTPAEIDLADSLSTVLFRILQETLTNVIRHSGATMVRVRLRKNDNSVKLLVRDNGRGITLQQIHHPDSFGIIGIRERVNMLKGRFSIIGIEGKGTIVTVNLPLAGDRTSRRLEKNSHLNHENNRS